MNDNACLDRAIEQCHQIVHNKEIEYQVLKDNYETFAKDCLDDIEIHKQLAGWLEELKAYREENTKHCSSCGYWDDPKDISRFGTCHFYKNLRHCNARICEEWKNKE